jgi:hypothetical protein
MFYYPVLLKHVIVSGIFCFVDEEDRSIWKKRAWAPVDRF